MQKSKTLRIALLHVKIKSGDMSYNHRLINKAIAIAAGYCCKVVITGELAECGEEFWRHIYVETVPCNMYPYLQNLKERAYKYKMHILLGRAEKSKETGELFSTYTHINSKGKVQAEYHKQMAEYLEEAQHIARGNKLVCTEMEGIKVGLLLGYNEKVIDLMKVYQKNNVGLMISGIAPIYHSSLKNEFNISADRLASCERTITIFSSYDLELESSFYRGESACLMGKKAYYFSPLHSAVIILDYHCVDQSISLVKMVNMEQMCGWL